MRFATVLLDGQERAAVADDAGLHPLRVGTVLDLVLAGLPAADQEADAVSVVS
jgi:hypothetical protein